MGTAHEQNLQRNFRRAEKNKQVIQGSSAKHFSIHLKSHIQFYFLLLSIHQTYSTSCIIFKYRQPWTTNTMNDRPTYTSCDYCSSWFPPNLWQWGRCFHWNDLIRRWELLDKDLSSGRKRCRNGSCIRRVWAWLQSRLWGRVQKEEEEWWASGGIREEGTEHMKWNI